jgi:hypothetical protein
MSGMDVNKQDDFYVVKGECTSCGAPHVVAPDMIGWVDESMSHCYWKKQPETEEDWRQTFKAFDACCIGCYRYRGNDVKVMERIGKAYCDEPLAKP